MTDVLFITPTDNLKLSNEVNGTMILATLLRQANISARILRFGQIKNLQVDYKLFLEEIIERIISMEPRSVSFYTLWPQYHIMLRIAKELKRVRPDLPIVFGGPQASVTAKSTMNAAPYVDYICCGEGEQTVVTFFRALLSGDKAEILQTPGLYYRSEGVVMNNSTQVPLCDLNTLPRWDEALYINDYSEAREKMSSPTYFMPIDAGRGCPYSCTFCTTSRFWRRTYRLKSAERLVADIRYYKERFGITSFWFSHDAFTTNMKLVEEVCDRLIEENLQIQWKCTSRVDRLTESFVRKMTQAGLVHIEMGIESGSQDVQRRINKKLNLDQVQHMVDFLMSEKIKVHLFFMYGFPDETEEELAQTVSLQLDLLDKGVSHTSMSFCKFNPATAMTEKYFDQLEFDPTCKILARGLPLGYDDELSVITANKDIFPFFYHLNTPVRNEYQYLYYFLHTYRAYRRTCQCVRTLYNGDDLRFYREWCEANADILSKDIKTIGRKVSDCPEEFLERLLERYMASGGEQLNGMLEFECDRTHVLKSKQNTQLRKTYNFVYAEYLRNVPAKQLSEGTTEFLLEKRNGVFSQKLLSMK